ncbi:MAG: MFS transporter [Bacteroidales bacterium]|nr:MFS transporter [Bacteroidales bacterium]
MTVAVVMYKNLGLSNTEIALYTSWLYLPWVIKPIWSPFIDLIKTKRWWINAMQSLIAAAFAGIAFFIPTTHFIQITLAFFWLLAFASATHDIAADGFYMHGLEEGEQSFFVGIRNIFYRIAMIFGQGVLVMIAGLAEQGKIFKSLGGNIALSWSLCFYLLAAIFLALAVYHFFILPKPVSDTARSDINAATIWKNFGITFASFFKKNHLGLMFFFLLTYRLGESQLAKIAQPFMLDSASAGGLEVSTANVGLIYGTIGVIALLLGGITSGILISRHGFKKWILPMALAINIPDILYVILAMAGKASFAAVTCCVTLEQFGYGFGFTAYMMYLIFIAQGEHKTAHYAIGTGFMALGMMLPGMVAGWIADTIGYKLFFIWVCLCTVPGIIASLLVRKQIPETFGKKETKNETA